MRREASVRQIYMSAQAVDLKDSPVARSVNERHAAWEAELPLGEDAALWGYLTNLDQACRCRLALKCKNALVPTHFSTLT